MINMKLLCMRSVPRHWIGINQKGSLGFEGSWPRKWKPQIPVWQAKGVLHLAVTPDWLCGVKLLTFGLVSNSKRSKG